MPKGKKCVVCKKGIMRRDYIRSYHKGYQFSEEYITGKLVNKSSFNPIGWICDNCGIFLPDEDKYFLHRNFYERKEKQKKKIRKLRNKLKRSRENFIDYLQEYIYSEDNLELHKALLLQRHWNQYYAYGTRQYLKGIKSMRKYRYTEQDLKDRELTDDEILIKAERIIRFRKHGIIKT